MQAPRPGQLIISIHAANFDQSRPVLAQLVRMHQQHHVPATWALSEPGRARELEAICTSPSEHEVAILADHTWTRGGRTTFARELARRLREARERGIEVSTMALDEASSVEHVDLLVKHRISMVRPASVEARGRGVRPRSIRFGVWESSPGFAAPQPSAWRARQADWRVRRAIKRAPLSGELVHLMIDAPGLARSGAKDMSRLGSILALAAARRQKQQLRILTLAELAAEQKPFRSARPIRSVLRAA